MWKNITSIAQQLVAPDGDDSDYSDGGWAEEDDDFEAEHPNENEEKDVDQVDSPTKQPQDTAQEMASSNNGYHESGAYYGQNPSTEFITHQVYSPSEVIGTPDAVAPNQLVVANDDVKITEKNHPGLEEVDIDEVNFIEELATNGWEDEEEELDFSSSHKESSNNLASDFVAQPLPAPKRINGLGQANSYHYEQPETVFSQELSLKTLECDQLKLEIESLKQHTLSLQRELGEKAFIVEKMTSLHKEEIALLEEQVQEGEINKENLVTKLTRQLDQAQSEIKILRASVSVHPNVALRRQHETDLQTQYSLLDSKTERILELEKRCCKAEKAASEAEAELQQLAAELLVVAQERDLLDNSLQETVQSVKQMQLTIERSSRHNEIIAEAQFEAASVKDTLREVKAENGSLKQQLDDLRFESLTLKEDLKNAKLNNATLTADLEISFAKFGEANQMISSLQVELSRVESQHDEAAHELAQLRDALCINESFSLCAHVLTLTTNYNDAKTRILELLEKNSALTTDLRESQTNVEALKQQETDRADAMRKVADQMTAAESEIELLRQSLCDSNDRLLNQDSVLATTRITEQELKDKCALLEQKLHCDGEIINGLKTQIDDRDSEIARQLSVCDRLRSEVAELAHFKDNQQATWDKGDSLGGESDSDERLSFHLGRDLPTDRFSADVGVYLEGYGKQKTDQIEDQLAEMKKQRDVESVAHLHQLTLELENQRENTLKLQNRCDALEKKSLEDALIIQKLKDQNADQNNEMTRHLLEGDRLRSEISQFSKAKAERDHLITTNKYLQEQLDYVLDQKEAESCNADMSGRALVEKEAQIDELDAANKDLQSKLELLSTDRISERKELDEEIRRLRDKCKAIERIEDQASELARYMLECDSLRSQLAMLLDAKIDCQGYAVEDVPLKHEAEEKLNHENLRLGLHADKLAAEVDMYRHNTEIHLSQISSLEAQIDDLKKQIEQIVAQSQIEQENLKTMSDENSKVTSRLQENIKHLSDLQVESSNLSREFDKLARSKEELLNENKQLRHQVEAQAKEQNNTYQTIRRLESALSNVQLDKDNVEVELNRVKVEQQRVQNALNELLSQGEETGKADQSKIEDLKNALEDLQLEKDLVDDELEEMLVEQRRLKDSLLAVQQELQEKSIVASEIVNNLRDRDSELTRITEHLKMVEKDAEWKDYRILELETELRKIHVEFDSDGRLDDHLPSVEELLSKLKDTTACLNEKEETIRVLHDRLSQANEIHASLIEEKDRLHQNQDLLRAQLEAKSGRLEELEALADDFQLEKALMDDELKELHSEKDLIQSEVAQLKQELRDLCVSLEERTAKVEKMSREGIEMHQANTRLQQEATDMRSILSQNQAERSLLDASLSGMSRQIAELEEKLVESMKGHCSSDDVLALSMDRDRAVDENRRLTSILEKKETEIGTQSSKIAELESTLEDSELDRSLLQKELRVQATRLEEILLIEQSSHMGAQLQELHHKLEVAQAHLVVANSQKEALSSEVRTLQSALERSQSEYASSDKICEETKVHLEAAISKLDAISTERDNAVMSYHQLKDQIDSQKNLFASFEEMRNELIGVESQRQTLHDGVQRCRELENYASVQLQETEETHARELAFIRNENKQLRDSLESIHKVATHQLTSSSQVDCDVADIQAQKQLVIDELTWLQATNERYQESLSAIIQQSEVLKATVLTMEKCLKRCDEQGPDDDTLVVSHSHWQLDQVLELLRALDERMLGQINRQKTFLNELKDIEGENEELLVQFGLMKQLMDDSAELIQGLQIENASLQEKIGGDVSNFTTVYNDRLCRRNEELDSKNKELLHERDQLNEHVNELERTLSELRRRPEYNNNPDDDSGGFGDENGKIELEYEEAHDTNEEDMRTIVVSLAAALERSELSRAIAKKQLIVERELSAKCVRSMTDNVKKFYSSFAVGDI